jgi:hypothetical protein
VGHETNEPTAPLLDTPTLANDDEWAVAQRYISLEAIARVTQYENDK